MTDTVYMPAMPTARDAMIWIDKNSLPGDRVIANSDLPSVIDNTPGSSTFGRRVYPVVKGRRLTNANPVTKPHFETSCPRGVNDGKPIVELQSAMDPRTGIWYGGKIEGFTIRGGNQEHKSSAYLDVQGQTGIFVNPNPTETNRYPEMCSATLCTISEVYHDGYNGPGGTLACWFEWTCRMAQVLHYDGAYMKLGRVQDCHRAYAAELYGTMGPNKYIHGAEISDMEMYGNPGYWDYPVMPGNGYNFGLRFLRNKGDEWAWNGTWNFNGILSCGVYIEENNFTHEWRDQAVDLRNVYGGRVYKNVMPCDGEAFATWRNCDFVGASENVGGPNTTKQSKLWGT